MSTKVTDKKKARTFSMTDAEWGKFCARLAYHGFSDRTEYLLALLAYDSAQDLMKDIEPSSRREYLKLSPNGFWKIIEHGEQLGIVIEAKGGPKAIAVAEAKARYLDMIDGEQKSR